MATKYKNGQGSQGKHTPLDERQVNFLNYYLDPKSETFKIAYRSAVKAGYAEEYAKTITAQESKWLSERINNYGERFDDNLLYKKHLELLNKQEVVVRNNVSTGEIETIPTGEIDANAVKSGLDMAYKVKGQYAPEKHLSVHLNLNNETKEKSEKLIKEYLGADRN